MVSLSRGRSPSGAARADVAGGLTLAAAFDPRRNSLTMMRLGLALLVAVAHALSNGYEWQPHIGRTALSDFAVDGFFVLSGFLVTRSLFQLRSVGRYAWHRFLRIMPAFWVCLLVTAFVLAPLAALLDGRAPESVFTASTDPAWRYPLVNGALPILQFGIADLQLANGRTALNGALWTLQYEVVCYGVVAVLGVIGLLLGRRGLVLALCAVAWAGALADSAGLIPVDVPVLDNRELFRFVLVFLLGAAAFLYADRLSITRAWAAASGVVVAATAFLPDYRLLGAAAFAYLCLYGMVRLPLTWNPRWDLSYGVYIYHYPVQFLFVLAGAAAWGPVTFVLVTILATVPLAVASWLLVEDPALRRKRMRSPFGRTASTG
jgi:peptidoglycan/LPS O-acetylase OafA/YrhL